MPDPRRAIPWQAGARWALAVLLALGAFWGASVYQSGRSRLAAENLWYRSKAMEARGNLRSREVEIRQAIRLDPANAELRYELAELLLSTEIDKDTRGDAASILPGRLDEAAALLDSAEPAFPLPALVERLRGERAVLQARLLRTRRDIAGSEAALLEATERLEASYRLLPRPRDSANPRIARSAFYRHVLNSSTAVGRDDLAIDVLLRAERDGLRPVLERAGVQAQMLQAWFLTGAFHEIGRELYILVRANPADALLRDRLESSVLRQGLDAVVFHSLQVSSLIEPLPPRLDSLRVRLRDERHARGLEPWLGNPRDADP